MILYQLNRYFNPLFPSIRSSSEISQPRQVYNHVPVGMLSTQEITFHKHPAIGRIILKAAIGSPFPILTLVSAAFAILGATGALPMGIVGITSLAAGGGAMGILSLVYFSAFGVGIIRTIKQVRKEE